MYVIYCVYLVGIKEVIVQKPGLFQVYNCNTMHISSSNKLDVKKIVWEGMVGLISQQNKPFDSIRGEELL